MVVNDRPIDTIPQQAAHRVAAGHVNAGQDDATNSAPIDSPEQTDLVLGIPVDNAKPLVRYKSFRYQAES